MILCLLLLFGISCKSNNDANEGLEHILNDFTQNSYYLSVKIQTNGENKMAIIQNRDCFSFFINKRAFDKQHYQKYMYEKISKNDVIYTGVDSHNVGHSLSRC